MFQKIKDIYKVYGYFYFRIWLLHILVILSLIFIDIKYFIYAIGIFLVYMPLMQLITHEYVSHEYIKPKNQWIDLLMLMLFYTQGKSVRSKRDFHINHHRHWQCPDKDPTQEKINETTFWRYVLSFQRPLLQRLDPIKNALLDNNHWVKLFDRHSLKIHCIYSICLFVILPWTWFIITWVYIPWFVVLLGNIHDQVFHGKIQSKDHSVYLPIFGSQAWHIKHHEKYRTWYHGPGIWKWLNLAWYYQLLFFKDNKTGLE